MPLDQSSVDRRQFGRRKTSLHGWIHPAGKPRLACLVRNVSEGGALLELDVPAGMPYWFTLIIDSKGFEARCEIRHQSERWIGVRFAQVEKIAEPIAMWSIEAEDAWNGTGHNGRPPAGNRYR